MEKKAKCCSWKQNYIIIFLLWFFFSIPGVKWVKLSINTKCCKQWKFSLVPERINLVRRALWINRNCCLPSAGNKKKNPQISSCDDVCGPPDWSILCRYTACNASYVWNSSTLNLGRENWPWISLWFLFYFLFLNFCNLGEESEHGKYDLMAFYSWEKKVSVFMPRAFFLLLCKGKTRLYIFGIRKTDLFAATI